MPALSKLLTLICLLRLKAKLLYLNILHIGFVICEIIESKNFLREVR